MHEPLTGPYTYRDYSALPEGAPYQLIGGDLVKAPSPTPYHQSISGRLFYELMNFVMGRGYGTVLSAPLDVYFGERETYQPDLIYIAGGRESIIGSRKIEEAPDLVVEILSPSNAIYDLGHKRLVYERTGVREFWTIDPMERSVEIYSNRKGRFVWFDGAQAAGEVRSEILSGFVLELHRLF